MKIEELYNPENFKQNFNRSKNTAEQQRRIEQIKWLEQVEEKTGTFKKELAKEFNATKKTKGQKEANLILVDFLNRRVKLEIAGSRKYSFYRHELNLSADNEDLDQFCHLKSKKVLQIYRYLPVEEQTIAILDLLENYGIELKKNEIQNMAKEAMRKRIANEYWWRRKIKPIAFRVCEQVWREMGHTRRNKGAYISDYTLRRFISRQERNRNLLENLEAKNQHGEVYTLAELSDLNVSNPEIKRSELMVRMRGFEEWAENDSEKWAPMFYTLTCPSKYHIYSGDRKNEKYNGSTPRDAQQYLCKVWSSVRAKTNKQNIRFFGFRIAEPHHDGCPHWHCLLFIRESELDRFNGIIKRCFLQEDGNERGAEKHRCTIVRIDPEKGSAAGYIAKYVSKNIDGFGVGEDLEVRDESVVTSLRVRCWASTWGIRQFQQIGGPPVTTWRELRRLANHPETMPPEQPEQLSIILETVTKSNWTGFIEQMGGAIAKRIEHPVKLYTEIKVENMKIKLNQYGEEIKQIAGVITDWFPFPLRSRVFNWIVEFAPTKRVKKERLKNDIKEKS